MFRPCIDLHEGRVKQIVGGTLSDRGGALQTNFVSDRRPGWFADLYRRDGLTGGHVIKLGPGNDEAAREALAAWPGGLQIGGGIDLENAGSWLDAGASHVIVTSWLFPNGTLDFDRLDQLSRAVGKSRLVLDLSCRFREGEYVVVTNRWQTFTTTVLSASLLNNLADHCDEFLIHAVDVEGLCRGIDPALVSTLSDWSPLPTTYAGGATSLHDLEQVQALGRGRIHLTIGSALDLFGGKGIRYADAVAFNRRVAGASG
jgi:phosphoribosylformimino-5-aminoimidazole carboxamide ribotide isomerase